MIDAKWNAQLIAVSDGTMAHFRIAGPQGGLIAHCRMFRPADDADTAEAKKEAALIAAAPELLAALQEMVGDLRTLVSIGLTEDDLSMLRRAEAAIAKATGTTPETSGR